MNWRKKLKEKLKKVINCLPKGMAEYLDMLFFSAAENQIRYFKEGRRGFYSYTALKRYQKRMRRFAMLFFSGFVLFVAGIVVSPTILPQVLKTEIYIPNGKGDIMFANVSKTQATIIFKTLDAANSDKPLATSAYVEIFSDESLQKLVKRTEADDYAVTHIIQANNLEEGKNYYFKIIASDSSDFVNSKEISSWGDGNDPIKIFTAGETVSVCPLQNEIQKIVMSGENEKTDTVKAVATTEEELPGDYAIPVSAVPESQNPKLEILNVQNESYLQPGNKIQTIISWDTNFPADTKLVYSEGVRGQQNETAISDKKQLKHAAVLTTLKAGTIYYFEVKSEDEKGNVAISKEYSLRTPNPKETVFEQIGNNLKALIDQIKPR